MCPGLICGAFSSKYQEWYRVLLDDVTEDDTPTVTVFYLDYGNTEELLASRSVYLLILLIKY